MWKYQLQQFADRTGIKIYVSHFPPGTSKSNIIRSVMSKNRQGKPFTDVQTTVDLIGSAISTTGFKVICVRDDTEYDLAKKVSIEDALEVYHRAYNEKIVVSRICIEIRQYFL